MKIEEEHREKIINFGAFDYDFIKMANILNLDYLEVENEMKNEDSEFHKLFQKGKDMSDYVIDLKLFEMAKSGDIKALEKLDLRKYARKNDSKRRIK